jgi:hypothetical protein
MWPQRFPASATGYSLLVPNERAQNSSMKEAAMLKTPPDLHTRSSMMADGRVMITRRVHAPADVMWWTLTNGWLYATWVVGASRIRQVEPEWPRPGSRLHHSFGAWPALIDDHTEVLSSDRGRSLVLKARGWPAGEARVRIQVTATGPDTSIVSIAEDAVAGLGRLVPRPARQLMIGRRNTEALRRLALIAQGRHRKTLLATANEITRPAEPAWQQSG